MSATSAQPLSRNVISLLIVILITLFPFVQSFKLSQYNSGLLLKQLEKRRSISKCNAIKPTQNNPLDVAYEQCRQITKLYSKTFYVGTSLMEPKIQKHLWAIYTWCRRTDDIVDSPRATMQASRSVLNVLQHDLLQWEERLYNIWAGKPLDSFDLALSDTIKTYPSLSIEPFRDMIRGMVMDIPGLGPNRYQSFDELYLYCYRVAGTVGFMTLPLLAGTDHDSNEAAAKEAAVALGIAFQLTNILRDVKEDLQRDRLYLPLDELALFHLCEEDLHDPVPSAEKKISLQDFMQFQIARAKAYYGLAERGIAQLRPSVRFAVQASLDLYKEILLKIEDDPLAPLQRRVFTTRVEKLLLLPRAFLTAKQPHSA